MHAGSGATRSVRALLAQTHLRCQSEMLNRSHSSQNFCSPSCRAVMRAAADWWSCRHVATSAPPGMILALRKARQQQRWNTLAPQPRPPNHDTHRGSNHPFGVHSLLQRHAQRQACRMEQHIDGSQHCKGEGCIQSWLGSRHRPVHDACMQLGGSAAGKTGPAQARANDAHRWAGPACVRGAAASRSGCL